MKKTGLCSSRKRRMEVREWNRVVLQYADHSYNRHNYLIGDVVISYAQNKKKRENKMKDKRLRKFIRVACLEEGLGESTAGGFKAWL